MTVNRSVEPPASQPLGDPDRSRDLGRPVPQSADPIDRVVRLAPKWTVFVLLACGLLVLGTVVWAVRGTVISEVSTPGMYSDRGAMNVAVDKVTTVDRVLVKLGQEVVEGQDLVVLADGDILTSPQDGTVTSVLVSDGSLMYPGKNTVVVTDLAEPDTVVTVVPADMTGAVVVGLPVRMEVSIAPSSQYGYLLGTIDEISLAPFTVDQTAEKLGLERDVVASLLGDEPALLTTIRLSYDASTPSDYRWSVGDGPPFLITQGVPITVQTILSERHPYEVVFPRGDRDGS